MVARTTSDEVLHRLLALDRERSHVGSSTTTPVTRARAQFLLDHEDELKKVRPRDFENLVAELFRAEGCVVELVPRPNAPGPDIIVFGNHPDRTSMIVECKRWSGKVGVDVVRDVMYWVDLEYHADRGMIVTSSRFTKNAIDQKERRHRWKLELRDGQALLAWIRQSLPYMANAATRPGDPDRSVDSQILGLLRNEVPNATLPTLRLIDPPCQSCGGELVCGSSNTAMWSVAYYLDYFHVCSDCRWSEYHEEHETNMGGGPLSSAVLYCPMCGLFHIDLV